MIKVNIHDAKTNLSGYLNKLEKGETIVLCKRNIPFAEIRLLPQPLQKARRLDIAKGKCRIKKSFFDPLPDELLGLFEGKGA